MTLRVEQPHFLATCKDGTIWRLPSGAWSEFHDTWTEGRSFWSGLDLWDQPVTIKLGDITGMIGKTAESLALFEAEATEEKARAVIEGES